jgi:cell division protein FtsN
VIVPLLSLIVAVSLKTELFRTKLEATTMNPLVTAEFENNKKAVDESNSIKSPKIEENAKPLFNEVSSAEVAVPVATSASAYYVITGSFKSKENAESQVNMLKEEGFSPEIVASDNGFYRVCALQCSDLNTADIKKDSIAKKFPGTWVSRKK